MRTQVASTKLLFLTSDCTECRETWRRVATQPDASTVVVTPGPETESARRIKDLSGPDPSPLRVVMSSETWHAYRVTKAPWVIHIEAGKVVRSTQAD